MISELVKKIELNDVQRELLEEIENIATNEQVEINTLEDLRDLLLYLEEKHDEYPQLNKVQLGIVENKVEGAIGEHHDMKLSSDAKKTGRAVAKTTAGTVGRQVGKEIGEKMGGAFGKTLGGNVGAELARSIVDNITK